MSTKIHMDVDQLQGALDILNNIPSMLEPGGGASVSDLKECAHISDCLAGWGNGGNGASWISQCTNELYQEINQHVAELKSACSSIGSMMKASMDAYKGSDTTSSHQVTQSGQNPDPSPSHGRGGN